MYFFTKVKSFFPKRVIIVLSFLFLLISGFTLFTINLSNSVSSERDLVATFNTCTNVGKGITLDSMNCARDSLVNLASKGFVSDSLQLLEQVVSKDPAYTAACHGWAHSIGFAAASSDEYSSDFVLTLDWPNCTYGFNHGVQSFFFQDMKSISDVELFYSKVCAPILNSNNIDKYNSCIHLFGHFVADLVASDPETGFKACSSISGDSSYCVDGLIMRFAEFIDLENGGDDTFAEQSFDISSFNSREVWGDSYNDVVRLLSRYCSSLSDGSKITCAKRSPAVLVRALQREDAGLLDIPWGVVYDFCNGLDSTVRDYCFEGIGIIALNMSGWDVNVLIKACEYSLGVGSIPCVKAVARAFAYNNPSSTPDEAFCNFVDSKLLTHCRDGFNSGL